MEVYFSGPTEKLRTNAAAVPTLLGYSHETVPFHD